MDEMNKWGDALEALIIAMCVEADKLKGQLAMVRAREAVDSLLTTFLGWISQGLQRLTGC